MPEYPMPFDSDEEVGELPFREWGEVTEMLDGYTADEVMVERDPTGRVSKSPRNIISALTILNGTVPSDALFQAQQQVLQSEKWRT